MRILITGGAGYLGSIFTEHLLSQGEVTNLVVYDNMMYNQTSLISHTWRSNFEYVYGDVRDKELLKKYVEEADVIIPLAAIVGFPACDRDKELATAINYEHVRYICELVKNKNVKVVYPNTNSGYGIGESGTCTEDSPLNPISHYGITKVNAEKEVLSIGGISLRLATVFGSSPRMRMDLLVNEFVYKALTDKYITIFEKDFVRNYIHIRDVAYTFKFMIDRYKEHSGEVFNVGLSKANLSKEQLVEKIKGYVPNFAITYSDYYQDPDKRNYTVSNEKLESTGWSPQFDLDKGIQELIKTYNILISDLSSKYRNGFPMSYGNRT
jgi:nucleoside-diphosphate-sugar epimerase|tara:strand:+ start:8822 stop:9793 length:972 start_codon:yes stop_codon:yes gene_type:complete